MIQGGMMDSKHTPTPWKACKAHEDFDGPYFDIDPEDRAEYDAKPYTSIRAESGQVVTNAHDRFEFKPGDAAFIVKACNEYKESSCKGCKHEMQAGDMWPCDNCTRCMDDMYEKAIEQA